MEKKKSELVKAGMNRYAKEEKKDNPFICSAAIGFCEACKIIIPDEADAFDELIDYYNSLIKTMLM